MENMQYRLKSSSFGFFTFIVKLLTGLVLGLTFALIAQEMIGFGDFAFAFVITVIAGAFYRIAKSWKLLALILFDVFCVLVGMLLKMYILIAPGA
jgi:hypothetical protein